MQEMQGWMHAVYNCRGVYQVYSRMKKHIPGIEAVIVTGLLLPRAVVAPKYPGSLNVPPSVICDNVQTSTNLCQY